MIIRRWAWRDRNLPKRMEAWSSLLLGEMGADYECCCWKIGRDRAMQDDWTSIDTHFASWDGGSRSATSHLRLMYNSIVIVRGRRANTVRALKLGL